MVAGKRALESEMFQRADTNKLVPESWLPENWKGLDVLGLASGGGQQMPVLAATGANVTSFDFSQQSN